MRRGQKFSNRPKRTHEERRLAIIPLWLFGVYDGNPATAKALAAQWGAWDGANYHKRSNSLTRWMKRAHYLEGFASTVRRGKWADRALRGKVKRLDRAFRKRLGSGTLVLPSGYRIHVHDFAKQAMSLAR